MADDRLPGMCRRITVGKDERTEGRDIKVLDVSAVPPKVEPIKLNKVSALVQMPRSCGC